MSAMGAGVPWCRGVTPARRNPRAMTLQTRSNVSPIMCLSSRPQARSESFQILGPSLPTSGQRR
jgi:hypothetical protein